MLIYLDLIKPVCCRYFHPYFTAEKAVAEARLKLYKRKSWHSNPNSRHICSCNSKQTGLCWFYFVWQIAWRAHTKLGRGRRGWSCVPCVLGTASFLHLKPVRVLSPLKCRPFQHLTFQVKTKLLMDWFFLDGIREIEVALRAPFPFPTQASSCFKMEIIIFYHGRAVPRVKSLKTWEVWPHGQRTFSKCFSLTKPIVSSFWVDHVRCNIPF